MSKPAHSRRSAGGIGKRLALIAFGLLLPVVLLALLEGVLALAGVGEERLYDDPYVGFAPGVDLFVERTLPDGRRVYETNPQKLAFFDPQRFPADKAPGTYRIFALGGSTTAGRPYDHRVAFARWLELYLAAADPSHRWEVINAGADSYASYRIAVLMRELVRYQPDLFVVYTGHNEFLEERSYEGILGQPPALRRLRGWLAGFRFAALARGVLGDAGDRRPEETLPAEVTTRLDVWTGLDAYHRDDAWAAAVIEHFASNLERMVEIAADHGAGVVLVEPVGNLKDFSPFKSEHPAALPAEDAARFDALLAEGRARLGAGEPAAALELFEQARGLDPDYAELWFRIGRARLAQGEVAAAETALVRARDLDVAPLRAVSPIVAAVRDAARRHRLPLIELPEILAAREAAAGRVPIPGDELLLDHVHPDIPTHALLAELLLEALAERGVVRPVPSWGEAARRAIVDRETAALDRRYYALRDRNLGKVLGWAGKLEEAEPPLVRAAAVLDDDPDLHLTLGTLYQRTGRPAQAAEHLERAVELAPEWPQARFNLGVTYGKLGRLADGIGELETALSLRPDYPEALYDLGLLRLEAGDPAAAATALERARAQRPGAAEVLAALGRAYREAGRPAEAAAALAEGVRRAVGGREEARARTELAATLARQGDPEAAAAEIGRAIAADPGYAEAHYTRGLIEARRGRPEAAAAAYEKTLELDPAHAPAENNLALLAAGRGDLGEARRRLERVVEVAPGYAEAWLNLGVVRDQAGDPAGAIAAVERAVELRPGDARFQLALGLLYAARGRLDDARPHLAAAERGGQTVPPEIAARLGGG